MGRDNDSLNLWNPIESHSTTFSHFQSLSTTMAEPKGIKTPLKGMTLFSFFNVKKETPSALVTTVEGEEKKDDVEKNIQQNEYEEPVKGMKEGQITKRISKYPLGTKIKKV